MDKTLFNKWQAGQLELPFKLYLVGGAVRDSLMGREPKDLDFVAVGATQAMFQNAFPSAQAVGKSFPVYLVPGLGEVAFARKERKLGPLHTDFEALFDPGITLEADLERRDLTINAVAMRPDGTLVDPFGGARDLQLKVLRHVGPAFSEDALRVFRLARFAAQLGFVIAPETMEFARKVPMEDLNALPAERMLEEFRKSMRSANPRRFIEELEQMGFLALFFPELAKMRNIPAGPCVHHEEGDALTHSLMVLDEVAKRSDREDLRIAALFHDLGKAITPESEWPSHHNHDEAGVPVVEAACDRIKLPTSFKQAAMVACREHMRVHRFLEMRKGKQVDLVLAAERCSLKAEGLALVSDADSIGRVPSSPCEGAAALLVAGKACREERGQPIPESLKGPAIGLHVRSKKGSAVRRALREAGLIGQLNQ